MKMFKDYSMGDRIPTAKEIKPKGRIKTFKTGSKKLDAVNNPHKSLGRLQKEITGK